MLDIAERLTGAVVDDDGGSVVDVLLEVTRSKDVVVAEAEVGMVVDDESTVLVDTVVLVIGVVTVVDKDAIVVGGVL